MRPLVIVSMALVGVLVAAQAFAQFTSWSARDTGTRDAHLSVFGALVQPAGDFGSTSSSKASFAELGAGLGLDFSARFQNEVETGALLLVQRNATNSDALGKALGSYLVGFGYSGTPLRATAKDWTLTWVLMKAGLEPPAGAHARVFVDVYAGALYGNTPESRLSVSNGSFNFDSQSWVGLALGAGAGVRWHEHLKVGLLYLSGSDHGTWRGSALRQPISNMHATVGYAFGL